MLVGGSLGTARAAGAVPTPGRYFKSDEGVRGDDPTGNLGAGSGGRGDKSVRAGHACNSVVAPLGAEVWGRRSDGVSASRLSALRRSRAMDGDVEKYV